MSALSTDREVYALKPAETRYERAVSKARGLSILVYPNGCKTFVVRYLSSEGLRRRLPLGDYPGLGLADARLKAAALSVDIAAGRDPVAERTAARAAARMGETLEELCEHYWKAAAIGLHGGRRRPLRADTLTRQKGLWKKHLAPVLGRKRYKDVRRADVRIFMEGLVRAGGLSPSSIASIGDVLRALFAYALHLDLVEANPTIGLTRPIIPESRTRLFEEPALAQLLVPLVDASDSAAGREDPHARMGAPMALALRFLILTLTRRNETAAAEWREIDLENRLWVIPAERTKNRKVHVVPLSAQALEILDQVRAADWSGRGFVFPSPANPSAHLDTHAMTRAVHRICERLGLPHGSPHDFRRTGATILTGERHRIRRFIVGMVLGHSVNDGAPVTAVYDRNEYLADKREALEAWGRHIAMLIARNDSGRREDNARRETALERRLQLVEL